MYRQKEFYNIKNLNLCGSHTPIGQDYSISSNRVWKSIKNTSNAFVKTVKDIKDGVAIITTLVCNPSLIVNYVPYLTKISGYDLTCEEWKTTLKNLGNNHDLQSLKDACAKALREREENERLETESKENIAINTVIKETEQAIHDSVVRLSKPINTNFQESIIQQSLSLLESNFGSKFLSLCKQASMVFTEYSYFHNQRSQTSGYRNPVNPRIINSSSITDDEYLNIVRRYIIFLDQNPTKIIHQQQICLSGATTFLEIANQSKKLLEEELVLLKPFLNIEKLDIVLPLETCFLGLVWCAMGFELMNAAFGDISICNKTKIMSTCNLFIILQFTLFAREGLPPALDGGISKFTTHMIKIVYNSFYDVLKPIVDLGISFANVASERMGLNYVITKNKTWNEILSENIYQAEEPKLPMWTALNMLHTFRVADAFLCSILSDGSFCLNDLKNCLMKLSPIPLNGEENKLLSLFWNNPYKDEISIMSKTIYGVFFNYDSEIEKIYDTNAKNMGDDINDVKIVGSRIFNEIHELNNKIGKGDPKVFDHYLVYCIAGKLKSHYSRNCICSLNQEQLAEQIYSQITQSSFA